MKRVHKRSGMIAGIILFVCFAAVTLLPVKAAYAAQETGWQKEKGKWYYYSDSGEIQTGWQQIKGKWYYLGESGAMQTGWQEISGKWYYFSGSGVMQTGWHQSAAGNWYYLKPTGSMRTGWYQSAAGNWYYLAQSGVMRTGWQEIKGKWYYFAKSGVMQTGWIKSDGKWYYMRDNGSLDKSRKRSKAEKMAAERLEECGGKLKAAFNWSAFLPRAPEQPMSDTAEEYAEWSFSNEKGHCVGKAATFYYMAKELGYDATLMYGYVLNASGGKEDHAWVEIVWNDETYVCDPSFHGAQSKNGKTGYFIQYGQAGTWVYTDYEELK